MEEAEFCIESVKLAVCNAETKGMSGRKILMESIEWLQEKYKATADQRFLEIALNHIEAYKELGFDEAGGGKGYGNVLEKPCLDKDELNSFTSLKYKSVRLNKIQIRTMIKRWSPYYHSMPITAVIEDILAKVTDGVMGNFFYFSGCKLLTDNKTKIPKDWYQLTITNTEAIFYDVRRNLYYTIIK